MEGLLLWGRRGEVAVCNLMRRNNLNISIPLRYLKEMTKKTMDIAPLGMVKELVIYICQCLLVMDNYIREKPMLAMCQSSQFSQGTSGLKTTTVKCQINLIKLHSQRNLPCQTVHLLLPLATRFSFQLRPFAKPNGPICAELGGVMGHEPPIKFWRKSRISFHLP